MSIRPNQLKTIIRTALASGDAQDHLKHLGNSHGSVRPHNLRPRTALHSSAPQSTTLPNHRQRTDGVMAKTSNAPATGQLTHSHR